MPQAIGFALAWLASNAVAALGGSVIAQATVAAAAASLGSAVFAIGVGLALSALLAKPPLKPSEGQIEDKDPLSPRRTSYGTVRLAAVICFREADTFFAGGSHSNLWTGHVFNHGRVDNIVTWQVDEIEVTVNGSTFALETAPYNIESCFIYFHLGAATEAEYTDLQDTFNLTDMRGDGMFTAVSVFDAGTDQVAWQEAYPEGRPLVRVTFSGTVVWDPRDDAQDREDETTWVSSDNLAVCWLNYLLDPNGYAIPWDWIEPNLAEWIAAMDACDVGVEQRGGSLAAKYKVAGTWLHTTDPAEVVRNFEIACDGRMWTKRDGSIGVSVGVFDPETDATVTIDSRDIIGISDLQHGVEKLSPTAGVRARYMSPDHDYREHDAEAWPTGEEVLLLSEDRVLQMDLTWVPSHSQARRLMKRANLKANAEWQGTIQTNVNGLRAMDERYIRITIPEIEGLDILAEIGKFTLDPVSLTCEISFISIDLDADGNVAMEQWNAATEEGDPEGGAFVLRSEGSKVGTTFNPLTEGGALPGDTVYVFCASTAVVLAAPTDWSRPQSTALTNGISIGFYKCQVTGDEATRSFLTNAGPICWVTLSGAPNSSEEDLAIASFAAGGGFTAQTPDSDTIPHGFIQAVAYLSDVSEEDAPIGTNYFSNTDPDPEPTAYVVENGASISGHLQLFLFNAGATFPSGDLNFDVETSGMGAGAGGSFRFYPGG